MLTLEGVVIGAGGLTVIIVALKTLTTWSPAVWVFQQLVSNPVRAEMKSVVESHVAPTMEQNRKDVQVINNMVTEVLREVTVNGGASLKDLVVEHGERIIELRQDYASLSAQVGRIEAASTKE